MADNVVDPTADQNAAYFEELGRAMGLIFNNTYLYGVNHGVTRKAVEDGFAALTYLLEQTGELIFTTTEDGLMVNGVQIEQKNPLMRTFVNHLVELEVKSFSLTKGMSHEKFEKLIGIMNTKPEVLKEAGGFAAVLDGHNIEGVRTSKITYVQVTEDELVVNKKNLEEVAATAGGKGSLDDILAFLKGDAAADDKKIASELHDMGSQSSEIADVVLRSAKASKESEGPGSGQNIPELVIGNVKKIYDALMKDPAAKSQKGKKEIEKILQGLEEQILTKMREGADGIEAANDAVLGEVKEAVESMMDELKIEALAAEYMKKRKAIEMSEKRILRFIKMKGLDRVEETELQDKLNEGGLSHDEWKELLGKTGIEAPHEATTIAGQNVDGVIMLGHLASLLTQMEEMTQTAASAAQGAVKGSTGKGAETDAGGDAIEAKRVTGVLAEVNQELGDIAADAGHKIDVLIQDLRADAVTEAAGGPESEKKMRMSRRQLMVVLAEIVQELCQPLAVINCALSMILSKSLGEVTAQQAEMLNLAVNGGDKMKQLTDSLMEISGLPTTLSPDQAIQKSLYK
jgi:hypothetical protein